MIRFRLPDETLTLYNLNELARMFGITYRSAWAMVSDGKIPATRLRRRWYVAEPNIRAYLLGARRDGRRKAKVDPPTFPTFTTVDIPDGEPDPFFTAEDM